MKLDKIDLKILAALQRDGRITKLNLATEAGLSAAACWERLRRLEKAGAIARYGAVIDAARLGRFATVLVEITLKSHRQADFQRFEATVMREPAIVACDAVGGGIDYLLRVVTTDIDSYQRLIDGLLEAEIGIDRYFTYIVTKTIKQTGFPLEIIEGTIS
ncbi:Lrp/AsnC family transcriptional regulator [Labrys sp. KB_33_2]|uniref:Lrp/AsnC family transcriptional regulator n=1 Tax=unclassified Labrys (in: a-proteobacteria) TaxID=2688601 RepID=UPI003EBA744E